MSEPPASRAAEDDVSSVDRAIAALESQRATLGDDVVDTALAPLRERRAALAAREVSEQRKLVTVLFADLVDFTGLSGRVDAEVTRAVVGRYFDRWHDAINAHGGTVEKFIGDAVMAVFGLYQSWEDDAQRAVRAALAMNAELADLNRELEVEFGIGLAMRVGIDTGEVVVSTLDERAGHEFVAVGPTVNRASRLQAAAPEGGVLISSDTHRQVRGWFSLDPRPGLRLKGVAEPVDAYLVVSERPHGFRLDRAGGVEGVETTTVGRELELRYLQERLWDVVEEQRWRVVTVLGDAGVGKSRLLLDFDSWLGERPEPVWWFRGRASHAGKNHALALLHDLVAGRFQIQDSDPPEVVRAKFDDGFHKAYDGVAGAERQQAARLVQAWLGFGAESDESAHVPSDPQSLHEQATRALASYFARLSRTAPVVMLLEDLHWADDGSLRWLDDADQLLHGAQVLVVATSRPTLLEERPRWGEGLDHHVRLPLAPLSVRESRQLLGQILRLVDDPPAALVDLVIEAAEGNPFYIEELVTWLVDTGVIVKGPATWQVAGDMMDAVVVPSTLRGVLQARLDSLSASERAVVQRASVVGRVFWDEAVAHLAGPSESSRTVDADDTLDGLRSREIVFEREVSAFETAREFLFKHALLRDVAYEGVLRSHRERYHRLAARWLAEISARSGREREYTALIADHYDRAGDPEAAVWFLRAGRQAAEVFAVAEAARLLERALEIAGKDDTALRFDILAAHESVMERVGDRPAEQADLDAMDGLAGGLDDARQVTLLLAKAQVTFERSEYDDAVRWATRAVDVAEAAGLRVEFAEAHLWRGKTLTWKEELDPARESLEVARAIAAELDRPWLLGEALRYLAMAANNAGEYPVALDLIAESRAAFARDGNAESESMALAQYASTSFLMGRIDESRETFEKLLEFFRRSGHRYREAVTLSNLASIANSQGHLASAERWGLESVEITRQIADLEATTINLAVLGVVEQEAGRPDRAEEYLAEAVEMARQAGAAALETVALARAATLAVERDDAARAVALARDAVAASDSTPSPMDRAAAYVALGYAELTAGDLDAAQQAFRTSRETYLSIDRPTLAQEPAAGLALVALRLGDADSARELARPTLGGLDAAGLEDCILPWVMLHHLWQVFDGTGDPDAGRMLDDARTYLVGRADAMGDEDMKAGYLAKPLVADLLRQSATVADPAPAD